MNLTGRWSVYDILSRLNFIITAQIKGRAANSVIVVKIAAQIECPFTVNVADLVNQAKTIPSWCWKKPKTIHKCVDDRLEQMNLELSWPSLGYFNLCHKGKSHATWMITWCVRLQSRILETKGVGIMIQHPGMVGRSGCQARKKKRNPSKRTSRELPESQKMPGGSLEMSRRISDCTIYLLNYLAVALAMSILSIWVKMCSCLTSFQHRSLTHYGKVLIWKGWALLAITTQSKVMMLILR
jgi:hypothetical protein